MSTVSHSDLTPLRFLERSAEVYPDKVAIVYGDRRTTYASSPARPLVSRGPCRRLGSIRATAWPTCCPNIPELLIAHFAVPLAGAVLVAINSRLSGEEVRYICDHSGAKLLVVDAELRSTVAPVEDALETIASSSRSSTRIGSGTVSEASRRPRLPGAARAWI